MGITVFQLLPFQKLANEYQVITINITTFFKISDLAVNLSERTAIKNLETVWYQKHKISLFEIKIDFGVPWAAIASKAEMQNGFFVSASTDYTDVRYIYELKKTSNDLSSQKKFGMLTPFSFQEVIIINRSYYLYQFFKSNTTFQFYR